MERENGESRRILRIYVTLTLLSTFAWSFIWGINTIFLLDAGLSITEAFAVNAFFTAGQVVFEIPTGVIADTIGRRVSFLSGSATLFGATLLYLLLWQAHGPFWAWAVASMLLGLGFAFFSGATEAWLVDALAFTNYKGTLESAFAKGEIAGGYAMLAGTLSGGAIAQFTSLGVPYLVRAVILGVTFAVAAALMHDVGFTPRKRITVGQELHRVLRASLHHGFGNAPVRWLLLTSPFFFGVGYYAFYAMQPYVLELYGKGDTYALAGLATAIVAGAQIMGGLIVPYVRALFLRRTDLLLVAAFVGSGTLALIGLASEISVVLILLTLWAVVDSASFPVRQAFINGLIPAGQRATVLSFDNLLGSSGGIIFQPMLGRVADVWTYSVSYIVGAGLTLLALPFIFLARREGAPSDPIRQDKSKM